MGDFFAFRYGGAILKGPSADGTSGQVLQTDGSGNLSFATVSGGSSDITGTTAGAPSPAVDGDSDTGLFSPAPDVLALTAGGVEGLRLVESGGVVTIRGNFPLRDADEPTSLIIGDGASIPSNTAIDQNCTVVGVGAAASSRVATAVGYNAQASSFSTALGKSADSGTRGVAIGFGSSCDELGVAIGYKGTTFRDRSISLGSIETNDQPSLSVVDFWGMSSAIERQVFAMEPEWADSTDASRKARMVFKPFDTAAREAMRLESDGSRGYLIQKAHATAPADSMLPNSSVAFYDDGSGNLAIKLKDGSGTVKTGTVTLS